MKVHLVSHRYPPAHSAGAELYAAALAAALAGRGHGVEVFTAEKDVSRPDLALVRRTHGGIPVAEVTNNLYHRSFRETWDHPGIAALFGAELERARPDVVHVQHLMHLSIGCVEEAARRGIPVFFTLHDYWLHCARFGQRLHPDGSVCERIEARRCGECLASFKFAQSPLERAAGRTVERVRRATGVDLTAAARGAARLAGGPRGVAGAAEPERAEHFAREVEERDRAFRERILPHVHLFLAPSRFLRARFVEWGIAPERIAHHSYLSTGIDLARFRAVAREPRGARPPRVRFLGTLAPHKGPHVLLEAWGLLDPELRRRAELAIHGPARHHDGYRERLAKKAREVGARLAGGVAHDDVPGLLAQTDLLVVPSLWYENAPLVILEALAARTPLLVSDLGGMAELVEPGAGGDRFRAGDAEHLAERLARLLTLPAALDALLAREPAIPDPERGMDELEELYARAALGGA